MKKTIGIVIVISIIVFVTIFGIASLPDEVSLEPPSVDISQVQTGEEKKIIVPSESISTTEQSQPEEESPTEQSQPEEESPTEQSQPEETSEENVIKVKISDGVGTEER